MQTRAIPGRNEPCPCGSGKKYKKCHGNLPFAGPAAPSLRTPGPAGARRQAATSGPRVPAEIGELAALMNAGRLAEAESKARALIERSPELGFAWKVHGAALLLQGKDALEALQQANQLLPVDAETHYYLGNALHARGELDSAVASLRRAIELRPRLVAARNDLGLVLRELGRLDEAVVELRGALELQPDYPEALGNLANVMRDSGRLAEAVALLRRVVAIDPGLAEAHTNLGNALMELGQFDEAVASYQRATAIRPDYAEALDRLGTALRGLGRLKDAADSCRHALALKPDYALAHRGLGDGLLHLGQLVAAEASYRRALELAPDDVESHVGLAMALRRQGRTAEAEPSCLRALELKPDSADALRFLGELRADQGRFAEAQDCFRRAIAINPDLSEAWAAVARYQKMGAGDAAWLATAERLLAKGLPLNYEIDLRYSVGKYFDDLKDYEQAFPSYRLANELSKRYGVRYDRPLMRRRVSRIMTSYGRDWPGDLQSEAVPSERPVFIVGMLRSGTSLAEQILASHPAVFGAGELSFWNIATATYESSALGGRRTASAIAGVAGDYLAELGHYSADAQRVVDKMPGNFMNLGLIHAVLPTARIIHMQRHPIDTCLSNYFQNLSLVHAYAIDLEDLADYYGEYLRVMEHWRSILPAGAILEVPYEALVEDPEAWSRRMVDFIGLPWDPRCLDFHELSRTVSTASNWQVRQRISKAAAGRWHNYEPHIGPLRRLLPAAQDVRAAQDTPAA